MLNSILTVAALLVCCFSFGQITNNALSEIKTVAQAEAFIEANPKADAKLLTIESRKDTAKNLLPAYSQKVGSTFSSGDDLCKILEVDSGLSFRVSYVYLSGEQLSKNKIDVLRQEIITKYKSGSSFIELAQKYTMDGNNTGDTNWFTEEMMVKEFEQAVRNHKKNEIFTVDVPSQNWYYVVLKTHDDTFLKKVTVFKVKQTVQ
jgi:hypothetical protein